MLINDIDLPKPIYDAMNVNNYVPVGDFGPSSLKYGAKEYIGRIRNKGLNRLASKEWAAFTGSLMHEGLEGRLKHYPEYEQEVQLKADFNEVAKFYKLDRSVTIGGTCDLIQHESDLIVNIWDYKTMSTATLILDDKIKDWTAQVNIYMWLLIVSGKVTKVNNLYMIPIFKDWTSSKSMRSHSVEDVPCPVVSIPKWTREQIEKYIYDKVSSVQQYMDLPYEEIPYCNSDERWCGEPSFKVCKIKDGKLGNALPNCTFDKLEQAENELMNRISKAKKDEEFGIKKSGGISVKCNNWCNLKTNGICDYEDK